MDKDKERTEVKAIDYEKMVDEAFQHLLNTYLASRHRKKVDIIKGFADCQVNHISCTQSLLPR